MTTGQRIAGKRKEAGLSQEALGAELGVSRQSIYKWESDAALPEIDKLVALSRRFGVTVGWLLGVEEAPEASAAPDSGELTEAQLKMVEEISKRYLAAQSATKPRKKWPYILAALVVLYAAHRAYGSIDRQFDGVYSRINQMQSSVSNEVYSISTQVESLLRQQNSLVTDSGTQLELYDLKANTVTFSVYAVPKTWGKRRNLQQCRGQSRGNRFQSAIFRHAVRPSDRRYCHFCPPCSAGRHPADAAPANL